ncbi:MAG TPA: LTA synthase family protein, partial [Chitinophagaceae bacterium]|nr:LTA synthase family protein [Chitinophagaceae bacterium]
MIIFRKQPPRQVNIYMALLVRLLIILLLLTVSRFIFYWLNPSYFPGLTGERWWLILQGGLRFDIAAIFYVNAVYIFLQIIPFRIRYHAWYQRAARAVFAVTNGLALLVNTVDMIYFRFTLRRSTLDVFREFQQEEGKGSFLLRFAL